MRKLDKKAKWAIKERDGFVCYICQKISPNMTVDHIHPSSRGGNNDPSNLAACCNKCNSKKDNMTLTEFVLACTFEANQTLSQVGMTYQF